MELFLNSVWALVGIAIVCLWLQHERSNKTDRRLPFIALVMLIVILFPVISVSDDLWSIQNPAETDTCQRRNHLGNSPHSALHAMSAIPSTGFAGLDLSSRSFSPPLQLPTVSVENPAFRSIQNRPPPAV
jgi:hypothetical protein